MHIFSLIKRDRRGITFIEVLIGIGLVMIFISSVYAALSGAVINMADAKQRTGAIALANERVEMFRHLPYEEIGTVDNALGPDGPVAADEVVVRNNHRYRVITDVRYKDDQYDGTGVADQVPNDFKQAEVTVSWESRGEQRTVTFVATFIPYGMETNIDGGTLSINVTDSNGQIVPNFSVRIISIDNNPAVDRTLTADTSGNLTIFGVASQNYRIIVSKSGYETVQTYPNPPDSAFTPINPDLLVIEGQLNTKSFILDQSADLHLRAVNIANDSGINGISFNLTGGRQIGSQPDTFALDSTSPTNTDGMIDKTGLSAGSYQIANIDALGHDQQYYLLSSDSNLPIELFSLDNKTVNFLFAPTSVDSLVVTVKNTNDSTPVGGASVHLTGTGFDQTITTDVNGRAYFPLKADPPTVMAEGNYEATVTHSGYSEARQNIMIQDLTIEDIFLNPQP